MGVWLGSLRRILKVTPSTIRLTPVGAASTPTTDDLELEKDATNLTGAQARHAVSAIGGGRAISFASLRRAEQEHADIEGRAARCSIGARLPKEVAELDDDNNPTGVIKMLKTGVDGMQGYFEWLG